MIRVEVEIDGAIVERRFDGRTVTVGPGPECDIRTYDALEGPKTILRILGQKIALAPEGLDLAAMDGSETTAMYEVGEELRIGGLRIRILEFGPDGATAERVRPCLACGAVISFYEESCPHCASPVSGDRRSRIHRWRIKGYELRQRIGAGGMGIVYEALRFSDAKVVAVKIMRPDLARTPSNLIRFVEEMRALLLLRHPNIVQIYDRGLQTGLAYIDMELVRGDSVRTLMRREGPISERRALEITWQIVLALDFAATKNVIHGDVKPSNFMLDERGQAKLCDFGLAVLRGPYTPGPAGGPESSGRKGTAAYAAPELLSGLAAPTVSSDIWSMGASLYHMLTGQLPFGIGGLQRGSRLSQPLPDARAVIPELRPATVMLMEKMTSLDPRMRYSGYRDLQNDLGLLL